MKAGLLALGRLPVGKMNKMEADYASRLNMLLQVGDRTRYNVHGWCLHGRQVIARPMQGCAHWVLQVPARTEPLIF